MKFPNIHSQKKILQAISTEGINDWRYFRKLANDSCELALKLINKEDEPRIWPHHFDTGIYAIADNKVGLGFGLAMKDTMTNEPYFYISGYTNRNTIDYNDVPELHAGNWEINENWKGGVLLLSEIDKHNEVNAKNTISKFLSETIAWYGKQ